MLVDKSYEMWGKLKSPQFFGPVILKQVQDDKVVSSGAERVINIKSCRNRSAAFCSCSMFYRVRVGVKP